MTGWRFNLTSSSVVKSFVGLSFMTTICRLVSILLQLIGLHNGLGLLPTHISIWRPMQTISRSVLTVCCRTCIAATASILTVTLPVIIVVSSLSLIVIPGNICRLILSTTR